MTRARAASSSDWTAKPGRYLRTGASRSTSPRSTSFISRVAVNVLVVEPIWKRVVVVTGNGLSTLVTPNAAVYSSPWSVMPRATPGTCSRSMVWVTKFSRRSRTSLSMRASIRPTARRTAVWGDRLDYVSCGPEAEVAERRLSLDWATGCREVHDRSGNCAADGGAARGQSQRRERDFPAAQRRRRDAATRRRVGTGGPGACGGAGYTRQPRTARAVVRVHELHSRRGRRRVCELHGVRGRGRDTRERVRAGSAVLRDR